MSLRTGVSLGILGAAAYFAWDGFRDASNAPWNPPKTKESWKQPGAPALPFNPPNPFSLGSRSASSWPRVNVGHATFECPCSLSSSQTQATNKQGQPVIIDKFKGSTVTCGIYFTHAFFPRLGGEIMLDKFSSALGVVAPKLDLSRVPSNSGVELVNGVRARRFDFDTTQLFIPEHVRLVMYSKGNHAWAFEVHSRESSADAEQTFQRIAHSVRIE